MHCQQCAMHDLQHSGMTAPLTRLLPANEQHLPARAVSPAPKHLISQPQYSTSELAPCGTAQQNTHRATTVSYTEQGRQRGHLTHVSLPPHQLHLGCLTRLRAEARLAQVHCKLVVLLHACSPLAATLCVAQPRATLVQPAILPYCLQKEGRQGPQAAAAVALSCTAPRAMCSCHTSQRRLVSSSAEQPAPLEATPHTDIPHSTYLLLHAVLLPVLPWPLVHPGHVTTTHKPSPPLLLAALPLAPTRQ